MHNLSSSSLLSRSLLFTVFSLGGNWCRFPRTYFMKWKIECKNQPRVTKNHHRICSELKRRFEIVLFFVLCNNQTEAGTGEHFYNNRRDEIKITFWRSHTKWNKKRFKRILCLMSFARWKPEKCEIGIARSCHEWKVKENVWLSLIDGDSARLIDKNRKQQDRAQKNHF